jgi:hypothetical protein
MADNSELGRAAKVLAARMTELFNERETVLKRGLELERQILGLQQSFNGLLSYAEGMESPDKELLETIRSLVSDVTENTVNTSLAEACRNALKTNDGWMSALHIRKSLEANRFDFSRYTSNPLSSIHTTLKRLKEKGEVDDRIKDNTTFYRWLQKDISEENK